MPLAAQEIPRKILALYAMEKGDSLRDTPIHLHAEMPLNHLGMEVEHANVNEPLPTEEAMKNFRGVLAWFEGAGDVNDPAAYCAWLKKQVEKGRKIVLLGEGGFFKNNRRTLNPECRKLFGFLGIEYVSQFSDNAYFFDVVHKDSTMVEFERKLLLTEPLFYNDFQILKPGANVYLRMRRSDVADSVSDLVFTAPWGGFAYKTYVNYVIKDTDRKQWRLNPFLFFEEAFGLKGLPRPDTTTLDGKRIFYSHIDGDGIVNKSYIDNESFSGEIIYEEILKKYPQIPITISFITGYFDMRPYRSERVMTLYKKMMSLPNVEVAAHGHTHPLVWEKQKLALKVRGFNYTDEAEILGSVNQLQNLLKTLGLAKKVALFSWTGDCRPTESQLKIPVQSGLLQMNGGDPQFDRKRPSYSFVSPLGLKLGNVRQIYASAPNENTYTHLWTGPFYGFRNVLETFRNTENPIRVKPVNVYYHYYSGERLAALKVVQQIYDEVLKQDLFMITAGEYASIANDFFETKMFQIAGGFRIQNQGHLRTIRFDHERRRLDLTRSRGVTGSHEYQGSRYVFLDESKTHTIFLK